MSLPPDTSPTKDACRGSVLVVLLALLGLLAGTVPALAAPATPSGLPGMIEGYASYEGQTTCDPVAKPGVRAFSNLVLDAYRDTSSLGIVRDCGSGGQSEHKEGRAWDWGVSATNATQVKEVNDLFAWLFATDRYGNRTANLRRLGIMYVIWNRQIWKAYKADQGWQPYSGVSPHTDHVHFSFGWAGARQQTSFWTGKVNPVVTPDNLPVLAAYGDLTLQVGSSGEAVRVIQRRLNTSIDGAYGESTKMAVAAFQTDQKLPVNGIFGPTEWRALFPVPSTPFGDLELIDRAPGGAVVTGWAIDADIPDDADAPLSIHVYADGKFVTKGVEDRPRPDLLEKYAQFTAPHGFRMTLPLADGPHEVCAYAINAGGTPGGNPLLGCLEVTISHSPIGSFERASQGPDGLLAVGWAIDPDSLAAVTVKATLDGTALSSTPKADATRPDVAERFTEYGENHGVLWPFTASQGTHRFCLQALNVAGTPGTHTSFPCRDLSVRHDAWGVQDPLGAKPGLVVVSGRALDPDTGSPNQVHVYVDGTFHTAVTASLTRAAMPGYVPFGTAHGYAAELSLPQGDHTLCSYSLNASGTAGHNVLLGCQKVSVNHIPVGAFEQLEQVPGGQVRLRGWAADPDSTNAIWVRETVDGTRIADLAANQDRPDIATTSPLLGATHGFGRTLDLADGSHQVCLTYVNLSGTLGSDAAPVCKTLLVKHSPVGVAPSFTRVPAGVVVRGWALDLDVVAPIRVRILVDGRGVTELAAGATQADAATAYPAYGSAHGFTTPALSMTQGKHTVCVLGLNAPDTAGTDTVVACSDVTVNHNPIGNLSSAVVRTDGVALYGWALDLDSAQPIRVHLLIDGKEVGVVGASYDSPGIATKYPGYGTRHNWQTLLHPAKGTHTLCAKAENLSGTPGTTTAIGCRTVTF